MINCLKLTPSWWIVAVAVSVVIFYIDACDADSAVCGCKSNHNIIIINNVYIVVYTESL